MNSKFIAEGIRQGDPGIVAVFEERPQEYAERASSFGLDLKRPRKEKKLEILYLRPLDLSVDETMHEILDAVQKIGAKRLVIDSLAGFEMALALRLPRGLSRIALADDHRFDRSRGDDSKHG
jgi:circadian clock protein KaiC